MADDPIFEEERQMDLLGRIRELAVELDWQVAFGGKSAGNRHLERVAKIAGYLLTETGEKCGDRFVVLAGAWLHDVGLVVGNFAHATTGAKIAGALLRCMAVEETIRERIEHCVEAHDRGTEGGGVEAKTVEAMIVHDADTLDKIGPLGVLRHSWKVSLGTASERLLKMLPAHLEERRANLYLDVSKRFAAPYSGILEVFFADRKNVTSVLKAIGRCAKEGIPSEETVDHLVGLAPPAFLKILREQLELEALKPGQACP
jgi:hypothetical protein